MKILLITEVCRRCVNCPVFAIGVNRYGPGGRVLLKNFTVFGRISGADFDLCETFRKRGSVHWLLYTPCKDSFDWITWVLCGILKRNMVFSNRSFALDILY